MKKKIEDLLPLKSEEVGVLIIWNPLSGEYQVVVEGKKTEKEVVIRLLENAQQALEEIEEEEEEIEQPMN